LNYFSAGQFNGIKQAVLFGFDWQNERRDWQNEKKIYRDNRMNRDKQKFVFDLSL